jgi:hypothetical protein
MSKVAVARKVAYLVELAAAADSMHRQTALLIESLSNEPRYLRSTLPLKAKNPRLRIPRR